MNTPPVIFEDWLEYQKKKAKRDNKTYRKVFIGERSYPHFDGKVFFPRIGHDVTQAAWLEEVIKDKSKLSGHPFLPFIREDKRDRRFRTPPNDDHLTSIKARRDQKLYPHIKTRPIMYASHRDACIFSFYSYALQVAYEEMLVNMNLQDNIIAYRSIDGKNNVDFAREAFEEMRSRDSYDCLMLDVKGFFDNLDHQILKPRWESLLADGFSNHPDHKIIYENVTKYRYLIYEEAIKLLKSNKRRYLIVEGCLKICTIKDYNKFLKKTVRTNKSKKGIPQGSPISGTLANIYLLEFDVKIRKIVVDKHGGVYQRYSDDIFILCPPHKAKPVYSEVNKVLKTEKLSLGITKTEAFRLEQGQTKLLNITMELEEKGNPNREQAQYLGFHFNGQAISIRSGTLSKHLRGKRKVDYLRGALTKTGSATVARQINKVRRLVKKG